MVVIYIFINNKVYNNNNSVELYYTTRYDTYSFKWFNNDISLIDAVYSQLIIDIYKFYGFNDNAFLFDINS